MHNLDIKMAEFAQFTGTVGLVVDNTKSYNAVITHVLGDCNIVCDDSGFREIKIQQIGGEANPLFAQLAKIEQQEITFMVDKSVFFPKKTIDQTSQVQVYKLKERYVHPSAVTVIDQGEQKE